MDTARPVKILEITDDNSNLKVKKPYTALRFVLFLLFSSLLGTIGYISGTILISRYATFQPEKGIFDLKKMVENPGEIAFRDKDSINILCMGLDENRDEFGMGHTKGSRTDTIFILSLDKNADRMGILSIPRDTWILISEEQGFDKVNSIYPTKFWEVYDKTNQDYETAKTAGVMQARRVLERYLGIEIDYYVLIKIKASKEMVDAIGGITVDVEKDMDYDDNWGNLHIHLKKGRQRLSGEEAVGYSRFRHDEEGDWGRIRRQQQVVQALVTELKKPANIMNLNKMATILKNNLDTDLRLPQIIDLANVYKNFDRDNLVKGVVTGVDDWAGDAMIIVPDEYEKERIVKRVLTDQQDIPLEEIRVRVVNGYLDRDLEYKIAGKLKKAGYEVEVTEPDYVVDFYLNRKKESAKAASGEIAVEADPILVGNYADSSVSDQTPVKRTIIVDHYKNEDALYTLERRMGYGKSKVKHMGNDNNEWPVDFTIIMGEDIEKFISENSDDFTEGIEDYLREYPGRKKREPQREGYTDSLNDDSTTYTEEEESAHTYSNVPENYYSYPKDNQQSYPTYDPGTQTTPTEEPASPVESEPQPSGEASAQPSSTLQTQAAPQNLPAPAGIVDVPTVDSKPGSEPATTGKIGN